MQIFDRKLKKYLPNYILQSLLATIALTIILYFENIFTDTAVVASLGATTFIIFAMPNYTTAQPRKVMGGHIIGIIVGVFCFYIASFAQNSENFFLAQNVIKILIPSLSVGLSIFIMVITNTEHPPAAGTALGNSYSRMVIFNYTGHSYHYFPLIADQIFTKIMVKRFGLTSRFFKTTGDML